MNKLPVVSNHFSNNSVIFINSMVVAHPNIHCLMKGVKIPQGLNETIRKVTGIHKLPSMGSLSPYFYLCVTFQSGLVDFFNGCGYHMRVQRVKSVPLTVQVAGD